MYLVSWEQNGKDLGIIFGDAKITALFLKESTLPVKAQVWENQKTNLLNKRVDSSRVYVEFAEKEAEVVCVRK